MNLSHDPSMDTTTKKMFKPQNPHKTYTNAENIKKCDLNDKMTKGTQGIKMEQTAKDKWNEKKNKKKWWN